MSRKSKASAKPDERAQFIRALAEYLAGVNQVKMSIKLGMCPELAEVEIWTKLRGLTPLFGYPTVDEAEKILSDFLDNSDGPDVKKAWAHVCADREKRARAKKEKEGAG